MLKRVTREQLYEQVWSAPLRERLEEEAKRVEASRKATEQSERWPDWRKQQALGPDRVAWFWYEHSGQRSASDVKHCSRKWLRGGGLKRSGRMWRR